MYTHTHTNICVYTYIRMYTYRLSSNGYLPRTCNNTYIHMYLIYIWIYICISLFIHTYAWVCPATLLPRVAVTFLLSPLPLSLYLSLSPLPSLSLFSLSFFPTIQNYEFCATPVQRPDRTAAACITGSFSIRLYGFFLQNVGPLWQNNLWYC